MMAIEWRCEELRVVRFDYVHTRIGTRSLTRPNDFGIVVDDLTEWLQSRVENGGSCVRAWKRMEGKGELV